MAASSGLRLENWIGEWVTVNVYSREEVVSRQRRISGTEVISDEESVSEREGLVGIEGFLQGVDPNGVIVLFDPQKDVTSQRGQVRRTGPELSPRYVFYPWQRVSLIERIAHETE